MASKNENKLILLRAELVDLCSEANTRINDDGKSLEEFEDSISRFEQFEQDYKSLSNAYIEELSVADTEVKCVQITADTRKIRAHIRKLKTAKPSDQKPDASANVVNKSGKVKMPTLPFMVTVSNFVFYCNNSPVTTRKEQS